MFFTTFFKHDLTNKTKKEKKKAHTQKGTRETNLSYWCLDIKYMNDDSFMYYHRYDSHWINSVIALIWIFISRWGGSSTYCELQGIWMHMKRIKSVCLHCQVTVVFRSVVTCYSGKPYLGLSLFNKTMFILHRFTKTRWQEKNIYRILVQQGRGSKT